LDWSADEINRAHEAEAAMANTDRIVKETAHMRNELESYIYDMRDKVVSDTHLGTFGTEEEKAAFLAKNESVENWLYEDGFDAKKSAFAEKLAELKALGGPMEKRQSEAMGRAAAVSTLQSTIAQHSQWVNNESNNDMYAHITDEERETVRSLVDSTSSWMYEMLDKQGGLAPHQDPVLTMSDLTMKNQALNTTCGPILRKPVPKKAPEPPKKEDPPSAGAGGDGDKTTEEKDGEAAVPMDVDTEAEGTAPMQTD
jgi:heat shock 70kDa protein 4